MTALYAIGDIHCQLAQLVEAIDWIEKDGGPAAPIVFLGDYIDRGPDSRGVLDLLIQGRDAGRNWTFLKAIMTGCLSGFCKLQAGRILIFLPI